MKRNRYEMKRGLIILTILVILFLNMPNINASPADLNSDNKVNATDIQLIIRWILGLDQSNPATDMDGNGQVNIFDLVNASRLFGKIYGADSLAPTIISSSPSANLSSGVASTILFAKTDERATCKYLNTTGGNYSVNMTTFTRTGGVSHSTTLTDLANGTIYNYYVQCRDEAGNLNSTNYNISFGVNSGSNEPSGFVRFVETDHSLKPAATGMIDGQGRNYGGARLTLATDETAPISPNTVLKFTHTTGMEVGASGGTGIFNFWDLASYLANTEYSEFYDRTVINVYGDGSSYEVPGHGEPGIKMFGYWSVAYNNRVADMASTQVFNFLRAINTTDNGYPTVPDTATDFSVAFYTQGLAPDQRVMLQNRNTNKHVVVGQWHNVEIYMKLNTFNVSDGIIRAWLDGILVVEYTNVSFINDYTVANAPEGTNGRSGFFHRYWDPVWGGGGSGQPAKSRDDYFLLDHTYVSGKWLRDKA